MAQAGFVFQPQPSNPDNVACFLCHTTIDGWEKDDDPLAEHLKHWPDCGWAITAAVEAEVAEFTTMHPLDPRMVEARKATFGGKWPYESKKAFKCKTKQVSIPGSVSAAVGISADFNYLAGGGGLEVHAHSRIR